MANCHDLFQTHLNNIRLDTASKGDLCTSRDANRDRIRNYFVNELGRPAPEFGAQGSYPMHTGVTPLNGNYDIDDGVYIQGLGTDMSKWPTSETVHGWLVAATKGYTSAPPQDKARCVRVFYKGGYHIDLPSYAKDASGTPMLFEKGESPYESNASALSDWFTDAAKDTPQIRRVVRYLKGWRDFKRAIDSTASGLALTILTVNHHQDDTRDDVALTRTAGAIHSHLSAGGMVRKPLSPYDILSAKWTQPQRDKLIAKFANLRDRGQDALDEEDKPTAADIWRNLLGDRFPKCEQKQQNSDSARKTSAPAILGSDNRSA